MNSGWSPDSNRYQEGHPRFSTSTDTGNVLRSPRAGSSIPFYQRNQSSVGSSQMHANFNPHFEHTHLAAPEQWIGGAHQQSAHSRGMGPTINTSGFVHPHMSTPTTAISTQTNSHFSGSATSSMPLSSGYEFSISPETIPSAISSMSRGGIPHPSHHHTSPSQTLPSFQIAHQAKLQGRERLYESIAPDSSPERLGYMPHTQFPSSIIAQDRDSYNRCQDIRPREPNAMNRNDSLIDHSMPHSLMTSTIGGYDGVSGMDQLPKLPSVVETGHSSEITNIPAPDPPIRQGRGRPKSHAAAVKKMPKQSKRRSHKEVEQKYRKNLTNRFIQLDDAVPVVSGPESGSNEDGDPLDARVQTASSRPQQRSKGEVLRHSVEYIVFLETEHMKKTAVTQQLREYISRLNNLPSERPTVDVPDFCQSLLRIIDSSDCVLTEQAMMSGKVPADFFDFHSKSHPYQTAQRTASWRRALNQKLQERLAETVRPERSNQLFRFCSPEERTGESCSPERVTVTDNGTPDSNKAEEDISEDDVSRLGSDNMRCWF